MKRILLLAGALLLAACAATPQPTRGEWSGSWDYLGAHNYETQYPGLGVSHRFQSDIGWVDVYIYGLNRSDWADGVRDPQFSQHFDSALREIRMAERAGRYQDLKLGKVEDVEIGGKTYRHVAMRLLTKGKPIESHLYLTADNGELLKFRMSFFAPVPSNLDAVIRAFVERHVPKWLPPAPERRV